MSLHINQPSSFTWAWMLRCRRCKTLTNHVVTSYIWYGPTTTCCQCGAYVNDGVLRRKRKGDTKGAAWATAVWPTLPRRTEYSRWITGAVTAPQGTPGCTCYLGDPDDPTRDEEACAACEAAYWDNPVAIILEEIEGRQ